MIAMGIPFRNTEKAHSRTPWLRRNILVNRTIFEDRRIRAGTSRNFGSG